MIIPSLDSAVELPSGVYNVVSELKYSSPGVTAFFWQLDDDAGHQTTLGMVGEQFVNVTREKAEGLPEGAEVEREGVKVPLVRQGEAMAALSRHDRNDFWLARFKYYASEAVQLLYTLDKDGAHVLAGAPISRELVRIYE